MSLLRSEKFIKTVNLEQKLFSTWLQSISQPRTAGGALLLAILAYILITLHGSGCNVADQKVKQFHIYGICARVRGLWNVCVGGNQNTKCKACLSKGVERPTASSGLSWQLWTVDYGI